MLWGFKTIHSPVLNSLKQQGRNMNIVYSTFWLKSNPWENANTGLESHSLAHKYVHLHTHIHAHTHTFI